MSMKLFKAALVAALALTPGLAAAHTGHGDVAGLAHGFSHPLMGIDHVLAMVTVGVFAAILGGRALVAVPLSFVGMMAMGALAGMAGLTLPFVETGIALSVIVLGSIVALKLSPPVTLSMALVGFFAVFHGFAHGAEMPVDASGLGYGAGFLLATAALHLAGIALGLGLSRMDGARVNRLAGGAIAIAGFGLLGGLL
jgi:urease accessory protein